MYFPMFINIPKEGEVLLIGGGMVAFHKLSKLKEFDIKVHLIAKRVDLSFYNYSQADKLEIEEREFSDSDLDRDYIFVIAATDDRELNKHISDLCQKKRIPVNVVDDAQLSSFIFPSFVKNDSVVAAVSSGGRVPVVTQYLRDRLKAEIPENMGEIISQLEAYRLELVDSVQDHKERAALIRKRLEELIQLEGDSFGD